ncbi:hypothetical protein AAU57_09915 [Nonlabens sp. YIK11]|uniref:hypothetical protein n=1 Tax=Nonlabens sp. YIK11 TaxID=1453349 RepID=UPI0006DC3D34|nr:hypothetical protein [Nonlabens sp. YIK11]KQC33600.1 hypothetical protein AAU57_09915 [Nonlabens sp. YIK11]
MVHFNYNHLTRSKKLEEFITDSLEELMGEDSHISTVYCFLSRTFDNRDKLISTLKMQIRLKSNDSVVIEQSGTNFKNAFKTIKPELAFMFNEQQRQMVASA